MQVMRTAVPVAAAMLWQELGGRLLGWARDDGRVEAALEVIGAALESQSLWLWGIEEGRTLLVAERHREGPAAGSRLPQDFNPRPRPVRGGSWVVDIPVRAAGHQGGWLRLLQPGSAPVAPGEIALRLPDLLVLVGLAAERELLARRVERQRAEIAALGEVAGAIAGVLRPGGVERMLQVVAERARDLVGADSADLSVSDLHGCQITRASTPTRTPQYATMRVLPGVGVAGQVLLEGRPRRTADYLRDPTITHELDDYIRDEGVRALMCVPLRAGDTVLGTLCAFRRTATGFSDEDEATLLHLASQAAAAVQVALLYEERVELEKSRSLALRERILAISAAKEEERKALARELHDGIAQRLSTLLVMVQSRLDGASPAGAGARQELVALQQELRETLCLVRGWMGRLRIPALEQFDLVTALRYELIPSLDPAAGLEVGLEVAEWPDDLPEEVTFQVYRIVQEALHNVVRHARARHARVALRIEAGDCVVEVADDGRGFDPAAHRSDDGGGVGLVGLRERALLLGGELVVASAPGQGTRLRLRFPGDWSPSLARRAERDRD